MLRSWAGKELVARDTATYLPGEAGPLCFGHPAACRALSAAAESAGAHYVRRVRQVAVKSGQRPAVEFDSGERTDREDCRLVVGADGRISAVRGQAGIALQRAEPEHLIS